MPGHERYENITAVQYEKKTLMYLLTRITSDRTLRPLIGRIENCKVLDVGLGTGLYTTILLEHNCDVTGIDPHPHLCKLPITVHQADAGQLAKVVPSGEFDVVVSTWMTDYLDSEALAGFFSQARTVLKPGGKLITTVIRRYGVGLPYVAAAKLIRRINKYTYRGPEVLQFLRQAGFTDIQLIPLNAWLGIPWAWAVVAQ